MGHYQADEFSVEPNEPLTMPASMDLPAPKIKSNPKKDITLVQARIQKTTDHRLEDEVIKSLYKNETVSSSIRDQLNTEADTEKRSKNAYTRHEGSVQETLDRNFDSISSHER